MKKSQKVGLAYKGGITAFLSLIFILILSVVGALIESASIQITRSRKRADVNMALESAFAEYDRKVLEEYDLFARHEISQGWLGQRLQYYGANGMTHQITRAEYLSDHKGMPFYEQAVRYMKDLLGMEDIAGSDRNDMNVTSSWEQDEKTLATELDSLLAEEENTLSERDNPFQWLNQMKSTGLLTLVVSEEGGVSDRCVVVQQLPSHRPLQAGNYEAPPSQGAIDKLLFVSYLTEHFSDYMNVDTDKTLLYEQEYLLGGCETDRDNLEAVCRKILNARMAVNYLYLLADPARQAEAGALATGICSMFASPYISEVLKQALLIAWAYGESVVDVRVLLKGENVAAIKTSQNWQLQISNLTKLGTSEEVVTEHSTATGLSYVDYLKLLFAMEDLGNLCMRSLDMIESNLHIKTDEYMTKVEIVSRLELRHGIKDEFKAGFSYR